LMLTSVRVSLIASHVACARTCSSSSNTDSTCKRLYGCLTAAAAAQARVLSRSVQGSRTLWRHHSLQCSTGATGMTCNGWQQSCSSAAPAP
jgi:hypothetical protein